MNTNTLTRKKGEREKHHKIAVEYLQTRYSKELGYKLSLGGYQRLKMVALGQVVAYGMLKDDIPEASVVAFLTDSPEISA